MFDSDPWSILLLCSAWLDFNYVIQKDLVVSELFILMCASVIHNSFGMLITIHFLSNFIIFYLIHVIYIKGYINLVFKAILRTYYHRLA